MWMKRACVHGCDSTHGQWKGRDPDVPSLQGVNRNNAPFSTSLKGACLAEEAVGRESVLDQKVAVESHGSWSPVPVCEQHWPVQIITRGP